MKSSHRRFVHVPLMVLLAGSIGLGVVFAMQPEGPEEPASGEPSTEAARSEQVESEEKSSLITAVEPQPIPEFAWRGIEWLAEAQHSSGGWGAGSHSNQQNIDPHNVSLDPATTAFAASTFLRVGSTPTEGRYQERVRKATLYLVETVEQYEGEGPKITDLTGTQIQAKLGQLIDTVMTAQYLARVLPLVPAEDPLHVRIDGALKVCLGKLEESQHEDGSWNTDGGWAPVLQSSLACNTFELAQVAGLPIAEETLRAARNYQQGNFDTATGDIDAAAGAGVGLYAFAGAQRANAGEGQAGTALIQEAIREGELPEGADVTAENLAELGLQEEDAERLAGAAGAALAQRERLNDEALLRGFGNNGGEEFLSFLLASEALVIQGGEPWEEWNAKMHERLSDIQNRDGSWNGHHCITSPVFCTAAVVQCVTCDRDAESLCEIARRSIEAVMQGIDEEDPAPSP